MKFRVIKENIGNILLGFSIGVIISGTFYLVNFSFSGSSTIYQSIIDLHTKNNAIWLINSLPIIFIFFTILFRAAYHNKVNGLQLQLEQELEKSKNTLQHINEIYKGNLEYEQESDTKEAQILFDLQERIKENQQAEASRIKEDEQRHWTSNGYAKFGEILRNNNRNIENLANQVTNQLIHYLKIYQGGFYLLQNKNENETYLELLASYAFDRQKLSNKRIELGCGLVGACALDGETIYTKNIPDNYINISSGLGNANPSCILIIPLKHNEELTGVLELASIKAFEPYQIEFLETLSQSIASTIINAKANIKTAELLEQSQLQSEYLADKEEELRSSLVELRQAQEESQKQSKDFKNFTDAVNHSMISGEYNAKGILVNANLQFAQKMGFSKPEEIIGRDVFSFIDPVEKDDFNLIWKTLSQNKNHFEGDIKHVKKDGRNLWMTATFVLTKDDNNSIKNILFLANDITERKEKSLDYSAQIEAINLSSIKVEILPNGDISEGNEEFSKSILYSSSEITQLNIRDLLSKTDEATFESVWSALLSGVPYKGILQFLDKDGKPKWFQGAAASIQDHNGQVQKIIYIANNVSKQKMMELEIQKSEEILKQKLDLAKQELNEQFKEIEQEKVRNDLILEGMLDAIFSFNEQGTITFFNAAAEDLWSYSKTEIINNNIKQLFSEETIHNEDFVNRLTDPRKEKHTSIRQEVNILTKDGDEEAVLMLISEANIEGQKTYTAFVQSIEMELF